MTNEITITLKGRDPSEPWIVVHSDPEYIDQALDAVTGDLIAKVHATNQIFQSGEALAQVAPQPAAAVTTGPWPGSAAPNPAPVQVAPATQPGAPVAPTAPGGGSELPSGIRMWTAPDPKKPQYNATWFDLPFITDKAAGDVFRTQLKNTTWAKWNGEQGDASAWYANTKHADWIKNHFIANAHLFQS